MTIVSTHHCQASMVVLGHFGSNFSFILMALAC